MLCAMSKRERAYATTSTCAYIWARIMRHLPSQDHERTWSAGHGSSLLGICQCDDTPLKYQES